MRVACIIPTYNAGYGFARLLSSLKIQTLYPDIYIVDSSSSDGTLDLARTSFDNVTVISSSEFNHGGTRQMMVDKNPNYDVYVFLTQDAYLADQEAIYNLVSPFYNPTVGAVCGRQLPHEDASLLSQHARCFNYPEGVHVKEMGDARHLGIKTAFISNSFAAYRGTALAKVGGFPSNVIFAEDMYVAAKLLVDGWRLVYSGNARCYHSHNYTIREEFSRYFDMGVFHAREPWIRNTFGGAGGEGFRFVKSELRFLSIGNISLWPISIMRNFFKLIGFKLGLNEAKLNTKLKRFLGMHKRYWDAPENL